MVDIQSENQEVGLDVLEYIHHHKTAALLEAAVVCGAICGGANDDTVEKLRKYALNIGLAFQVRAWAVGCSHVRAAPAVCVYGGGGYEPLCAMLLRHSFHAVAETHVCLQPCE